MITESFRRKGIGNLLMNRLVAYAREHDCQQVRWQVLDWNEPAINMYKKIGADIDEEWFNCKLNKSQIENWPS